jgi:Fe-S-cluster containining protein
LDRGATEGVTESVTMAIKDRLRELFAKVDAFFARTGEAFPAPSGITCHAGCNDCCQQRLSVTAIEAEVIEEGLAGLAPTVRQALSARARSPEPQCPALLDGRCAIYAFRPVLCRTHGLPIRYANGAEGGPRRLPVMGAHVDACPRNYAGRDLASLPTSAVLDQATVSTVLGALDAARADELGRERGKRVDLASLLAAYAD